MPRHTHQDALEEQQFEDLYQTATDDLDEPYGLECRLILILGGRLGMRAGEITHLKADWINWDRSLIKIPSHEPCECGSCRKAARQSVEYRPDETSFEAELARRWMPKTDAGARAVPFDFSQRIKDVVEEFFFFHDEYPHSRSSINRRVDRLLEAAGYPQDFCYPHALRGTAATYLAYQGVPAAALQSMLGWSDLETPQKYIRLSGSATAEALRDALGD